MFKPSCSSEALLLLLARLVTYSQTPLGLNISTLHLPPAYDPVPVLDHPHESYFSYLPIPALPAEWQHGAKSRTHHYLTPAQWALGSVKEAEVQSKQLSSVISVWDSGVLGLRGKPVLPALWDSGHGCPSLGMLLWWALHVLPRNWVTHHLPVKGKAGHENWRPGRWRSVRTNRQRAQAGASVPSQVSVHGRVQAPHLKGSVASSLLAQLVRSGRSGTSVLPCSRDRLPPSPASASSLRPARGCWGNSSPRGATREANSSAEVKFLKRGICPSVLAKACGLSELSVPLAGLRLNQQSGFLLGQWVAWNAYNRDQLSWALCSAHWPNLSYSRSDFWELLICSFFLKY